MILFSFLLFALLLINPVIAEDFNQTIYSSDSMISDYSNSTNNQLYVDEEKSDDENNIETDYLEDNIGEYENNNSNRHINRITTSQQNYKYYDILKAANYTSNYIKSNLRLPTIVNITNHEVNMNDFLYLTCKSLNSTNNVNITNSFNYVTSTSGTNKPETNLYQKDYLQLSNDIIKCYETNNRNPKNTIINNSTMNFEDTLYFYVRILAFKYNNQRLPNYVTIKALYNYDYSTRIPALISNSATPFTINITTKSLGNSNYNITFKAPTNCTIYYTINGTIPTNKSTKYTKTFKITNTTILQYWNKK